MAQATDILGDRWTLLILREAFYGVQRYDDMRADTGAPRSMLTNRLNKLVEHGLMRREPYQEPGSRVRHAYVLTQMGLDLAPTFMALSDWGEKHALKSKSPVAVKDTRSGQQLRVALLDEEGNETDLAHAAIIPVRQTR